jgi:hypothetical protein
VISGEKSLEATAEFADELCLRDVGDDEAMPGAGDSHIDEVSHMLLRFSRSPCAPYVVPLIKNVNLSGDVPHLRYLRCVSREGNRVGVRSALSRELVSYGVFKRSRVFDAFGCVQYFHANNIIAVLVVVKDHTRFILIAFLDCCAAENDSRSTSTCGS